MFKNLDEHNITGGLSVAQNTFISNITMSSFTNTVKLRKKRFSIFSGIGHFEEFDCCKPHLYILFNAGPQDI